MRCHKRTVDVAPSDKHLDGSPKPLLRLGPEWSVTIMQVGCGCTDPGCGETETRIMLTPRMGQSIRLQIAKPMRSVTAEDLDVPLKDRSVR